MNQAPTLSKPIPLSPENMFERGFERNEFEKAEESNNQVALNQEQLNEISNSWVNAMDQRSDREKPTQSIEIQSFQIQTVEEKSNGFTETRTETYVDATTVIAQSKGASIFKEAGLKITPDFKDIGKSILGTFSLLKELFMDTASLFIPKKEKPTERVETDPEKAQAAAEKKAEKQKRNNRITVFLNAMQAQISAIVSPDAARMETMEKANINLTAKIGQESYKGIKDSFGRLTIYAASLFATAQLDQEKQSKKLEKEQKMTSVTKGPDLNMDKVAEGGYLSSTGGQGAG